MERFTSQCTSHQSSSQIQDEEIEIRLKEACLRLAQGKPDSMIKLAIEIQRSYYEYWAKLMAAAAKTSTEFMDPNTRHQAFEMLEQGNTVVLQKLTRGTRWA